MSIGEEEIGWAFNIRPEAMNSKTKNSKDTHKLSVKSDDINGIALNEGFMNPEQINLS